jgi:predicted RNase H-like nuclease (RuvC/YqgF family)
MTIDRDGRIDIAGLRAARICEEFNWNIEDMAWGIEELRDEIEKNNKEIERLEKQLSET